jgi:hypothetical protein
MYIRVDDCGVTLAGLIISCVRFKLEHKLVSTLEKTCHGTDRGTVSNTQYDRF